MFAAPPKDVQGSLTICKLGRFQHAANVANCVRSCCYQHVHQIGRCAIAGLCMLFANLLLLEGIAQGNPASAYNPPAICVPATEFETAGAAQVACDAAAALLHDR